MWLSLFVLCSLGSTLDAHKRGHNFGHKHTHGLTAEQHGGSAHHGPDRDNSNGDIKAVIPSELMDQWMKVSQKYDPTGRSDVCKLLDCGAGSVCLLIKKTFDAKCVPKRLFFKGLRKGKLEKFLKKDKYLKRRWNLTKRTKGHKHHKKELKHENHLKAAKDPDAYQVHMKQYIKDYENQPNTHAKKAKPSKKKDLKYNKHMCSLGDFDVMAQRLVDWFHVQQEDDKKNTTLQVIKGAHTLKNGKTNEIHNQTHKGTRPNKHNRGGRGKHHPGKHRDNRGDGRGKKHPGKHRGWKQRKGHRKHGKHHRKSQHHIEKRIRRVAARDSACRCLAPVEWMFAFLDINRDRKLMKKELEIIEDNHYEHCLKPFVDSCDQNTNEELSYAEWCCCFATVEPPCYQAVSKVQTIMLRGELKPLGFVPQCDADGYFNKLQCDGGTRECWCADTHGHEIANTRQKGDAKC